MEETRAQASERSKGCCLVSFWLVLWLGGGTKHSPLLFVFSLYPDLHPEPLGFSFTPPSPSLCTEK